MTRDEFIEYLFHNGAGQEATLLRLYQGGDTYLGGWSKQAIAAKVDELLKAEREQAARIAALHDHKHPSGFRCDQGLAIAAKIREGDKSMSNEIQVNKRPESPRPAQTCRVCGAEERRGDFGGVAYTTIAPYSGLCPKCINSTVCR